MKRAFLHAMASWPAAVYAACVNIYAMETLAAVQGPADVYLLAKLVKNKYAKAAGRCRNAVPVGAYPPVPHHLGLWAVSLAWRGDRLDADVFHRIAEALGRSELP